MAADRLDYLQGNVAAWEAQRERQVALARRQWAKPEPTWGEFEVPEATARLLPADLAGARVVELGCGTAYVSAWLARRGAWPVAVDPAPGQLQIAAGCQEEFGIAFPLVQATGEDVPLRSGWADLVISEYGAAIWADPHRWVPEAARLLRPAGRLVFLGNSTLVVLCMPEEDGVAAGDRLLRPQRGMHRIDWADTATTEFHLGHGDLIRLLRASGFDVEDLVELWPPPGAGDSVYVTAEWARRWPCEEVWRARRR